MFEKITRKYFANIYYYTKILYRNSLILKEHPFFYLRNFLNILKSSSSTLIIKFPKYEIESITRQINGVNFNFDFNFNPTYRGMFLGLSSTSVVRNMLKSIKKGSVFIDVGANIGYLSAIGASLVGKKGQVHSFEPVKTYFEKLSQMAKINKKYQIIVNNCALGESSGFADIDLNDQNNLGWNTLVSGWMAQDRIKETIRVKVKRLDDYIFENNLDNISCIKIDVEGFELPVLKGLTKFFEEKNDNLPPLIVEVVPKAYPILGIKLEDLDNLLKNYSYNAYSTNEKYLINVKNLNRLPSWTDVLFKQ